MRSLIKPLVRSNFRSTIKDAIQPTIDYVARLNGTDQYWQLSEDINYGDDDFAIEVEFSTTVSGEQNHMVDYKSDLYSKITINDSGRIFVLLGNGSNWERFITGSSIVNDGKNHKIKLSRVSSQIFIHIDGVEDATSAVINPLDVRFSRLGRRSNGTQFFSDYVKNLSFYSGETITDHIPLTNKAQGATQLPTVGNVSATMVGYSEGVWEQV